MGMKGPSNWDRVATRPCHAETGRGRGGGDRVERQMSGISTVLAGEAASAAAAEQTYSRFRPDALRRRLLALADVAAVLSGAGVIALVDGRPGHALGVALMLPAWIVLAKLCGLYDHDHRTLRPL